MKTRKILSFLLACVMMLSMAVTAFAAEEEISIIDVDPDTLVRFEEVIGTPEMQTGEVIEDSQVDPCAVGDVLFSMTAARVSQLLTTYNIAGKSFTGAEIASDQSVEISGTLTSSLGVSPNYRIKVGVCRYNATTDTFITAMDSLYFKSGFESSVEIPKFLGGDFWSQYLYNTETYYGHITNTVGSGYVSGTLTFTIVENIYIFE